MNDTELFNSTFKTQPVNRFGSLAEKNNNYKELDISKRFGIFLISNIMVRQNPREVLKVMSQCIIVRCEFLWMEDAFEYKALSSHFEEVEEGCLIPKYHWIITSDGSISCEKGFATPYFTMKGSAF